MYETLSHYSKENEGYFPRFAFIESLKKSLDGIENLRKIRGKRHYWNFETLELKFDDLAEDLLWQLNQEFLRARYGGMYETEKGCQDLVFRISSVGFDWYPTICRFVRQTKLYTKTVTIVRDAESTGMGNACYLSLDGIA